MSYKEVEQDISEHQSFINMKSYRGNPAALFDITKLT